MLARSWKSPDELGIEPEEYSALLKVLLLLESGNLVEVPPDKLGPNKKYPKMGFNMGVDYDKHRCGTVACIGGWMAHFMEHENPNGYVHDFIFGKGPLSKLFWGNTQGSKAEAIVAIHNFLMTGDPQWEKIVV